jgi:hypothetical protein
MGFQKFNHGGHGEHRGGKNAGRQRVFFHAYKPETTKGAKVF